MPSFEEDIVDKGFPIIICTVFIVGVLILLAVLFDTFLDYRSQPAQFACAEKGMDFRRRTFTTNIVCTRRISHGADTIYVK